MTLPGTPDVRVTFAPGPGGSAFQRVDDLLAAIWLATVDEAQLRPVLLSPPE